LGFDGSCGSVGRVPDLTFSEMREDLGVSEAHLRNLIRKHLIPCYWLGAAVRFQPRRIEAWKAAGGTRQEPVARAGGQAPAARPDARRVPNAGGENAVGSSQAWLELARQSHPGGGV
jgi:hypothetical protein